MKDAANGFIVLKKAGEWNAERVEGSSSCFSWSKFRKNSQYINFVEREGGRLRAVSNSELRRATYESSSAQLEASHLGIDRLGSCVVKR